MKEPLFLILGAFFMCLWITKAEPTNGVLGYWPLDGDVSGGELAVDTSGNGHHLVLAPGAKWVEDGMINGAVELDGITGNIVDVDKSFQYTLSEITVMAWIKGWKMGNWAGLIVGRSSTPFWIGFNGDKLAYLWESDWAQDTYIWTGAKIPHDEWALIAVTVDTDKATSNVYHADTGVFDTHEHTRGHFPQLITNLRFGWDVCCETRYFKGLIDEVIIYNYALDTDSIRKHGTRDVAVESVGKLTTRWALLKRASAGGKP